MRRGRKSRAGPPNWFRVESMSCIIRVACEIRRSVRDAAEDAVLLF